jgi:hypothetical protein
MARARLVRPLLHGIGRRALAQQEAFADWHLSQMRLTERFVQEIFKMTQSSLEVGHRTLIAMGRVAVDGLAETAEGTRPA